MNMNTQERPQFMIPSNLSVLSVSAASFAMWKSPYTEISNQKSLGESSYSSRFVQTMARPQLSYIAGRIGKPFLKI